MSSFVDPSNHQVSHAYYRCDRTAFIESLAAVVPMFLAQVVLMLRSVFLDRNCSVLTMTKRNRIYAVTRKNRMIVSCLGVITISQFILGLYVAAYAAARKCVSVT
jgi:hypothetical protein